jgi:hypothetical protein
VPIDIAISQPTIAIVERYCDCRVSIGPVAVATSSSDHRPPQNLGKLAAEIAVPPLTAQRNIISSTRPAQRRRLKKRKPDVVHRFARCFCDSPRFSGSVCLRIWDFPAGDD